MKHVLIACVNYNSYQETLNYLISLSKSLEKEKEIEVDVVVADNSTHRESLDCVGLEHLNISKFDFDNIGYLPAAASVINSVTGEKSYDYIIISNVDIEVNDDFFERLATIEDNKEVGWIAPQIWTEQENRDKNPKVIERYTKGKLNKIKLLYRYPLLDFIYTNTLYLKKRSRPTFGEMNIYAGHGSFMILTKRFFEAYKKIHYPLFLFGEELFLAELNRRAGLKVRYMPSLKVTDKEHTSTSKMKRGAYYKYNYESIDFILNSFYE